MARPTLEVTSRFARRMLTLVALSLLAGVSLANDEVASTATVTEEAQLACADRPEDELWYVSTRGLSCPVTTVFDPHVAHYQYESGWTNSDLPELLESPVPLTVVYVHGNRMSHSAAIQRGWLVYRSIATAEAPPMRFVIWSWPSDRTSGHPLRDVRQNAFRADEEGLFLAQLLNQLPEDARASLIGYSYGSRVVGAAMHILGGGTIGGSGVQHAATRPTEHWLRSVMVAPAVDDDAFAPGEIFQNAAGVVDESLVLFNPCDPILKRYGIIDRCQRHEMAMGYVGMAGNGISAQQMNVSRYIGKSHDERLYLNSSAIMGTIRPYVFWQ